MTTTEPLDLDAIEAGLNLFAPPLRLISDTNALIAEVRRLRAANAIAPADPCWGCDHAPHGIVCPDDCPCAIATLEETR